MDFLKPLDLARLVRLKADLALFEIRFPLTYLTKKLGYGKSNVSAYLSGTKPMSDRLHKAVYAHFAKLAKEKGIVLEKPGIKSFAFNGDDQTALDRSLANTIIKHMESLKKDVESTIEEYRNFLKIPAH